MFKCKVFFQWLLTGLFLGTSLSALARPSIIQQPADTTVPIGGTAGFSVQASGFALKYQWRLNGINLTGKTLSSISIPNVQSKSGGYYSVVVSDFTGSTNSRNARLTVGNSIPFIPPRDNFSTRYSLGTSSGSALTSDNSNATRELGEPYHAGKKGNRSIWFKWTAPTNGIVTFTATGSDFDTLLAIYTGTVINNLTPVSLLSGDDDSAGFYTSEVSFNTVSGREYQIAVDGYASASGSLMLEWNFENTTQRLPEVTAMPVSRTVGFGETVQLDVGYDIGTPLWFRDGSQTSETRDFFRINEMNESHVGKYTVKITSSSRVSTTIPADLQINVTDERITDTNAMSFDKFWDSTGGERDGSFSSAGSKVPASSAGPARGFTITQIFSSVGANKDYGEPNHCEEPGGASSWFTYQAPAAKRLHVSTDGSNFDTVLAVYTGSGFDYESLVSKGCDNLAGVNGQEHVRFTTTDETIYYIVVDGVDGASGTVQLNINLGDAPAITTNPQSKTVVAGSNATFTVNATGTSPLSYQWRFGSANITGATKSTYTRSNTVAGHAGSYRVVISNAIDTITSAAATLTVQTPPAISVQPVSKTVATGSNVTLNVTASGTPTPAYQWQLNGSNVSGATATSLTVTNFQSAKEGRYRVVLTNVVGSTISSNALLWLNSPLRVGSIERSTNGAFQLQLAGAANTNYIFEGSTNLTTWIPLLTNSSTNGFLNFSDSSTNLFRRFYRARPKP